MTGQCCGETDAEQRRRLQRGTAVGVLLALLFWLIVLAGAERWSR